MRFVLVSHIVLGRRNGAAPLFYLGEMNLLKNSLASLIILSACIAIGGTIRCERDDDDERQSQAIEQAAAELPAALMPPPQMQMGRKGYTCKGKIVPFDRGDGGVEYVHSCFPN